MRLKCVFFGPFRDAVGEKTVIHEAEAETVSQLLSELEAEYPGLRDELIDEDGLAGDTVVTKDKKNIMHLDGLETSLEEDSIIRLVPSVYGG